MYDVIIKNGIIADGTGKEVYKGDVAIAGEKIAAIGDLDSSQSQKVIDVDQKVIAPGFIDIHSHSDATLLANPLAESKVRQGITTEVTGQCGTSAAPVMGEGLKSIQKLYDKFDVQIQWNTVAEYRAELEKKRVSVNTAPLIGLGTVRMDVMGHASRAASEEELKNMEKVIDQGMSEGAFGVSSGLIYPPGCFSSTEELVRMARVVAKYNGLYVSHIRGESETLIASVKEAIDIGERSGARVHISHHKAAGKDNWGKVEETLGMIDDARCRGIDVAFDVYPYIAGSTSLVTLIPSWAHEGGTEALLTRLKDEKIRGRLKKEIREGIEGWENFAAAAGWENILIVRLESDKNKTFEGKTIEEAAKLRDQTPMDTIFDLVLEEEGQTVSMVMFLMCEKDVEQVMKHHAAHIGSDSATVAPYGILGSGKPHPRTYGTFPRVLGKYVREREVLPLAEAIKKMTGASADRMGMKGRGYIQAGNYADIVVFDQHQIEDQATFSAPHQYGKGIHYVWVNGELVVCEGEHTKKGPGKALFFQP